MADAEVSLKHLFQSQKSDGADTTKVRATDQNANHPFYGGAIGDLLYYDSGSSTHAKYLPDVAVGQALVSGGVGVKPAWSASPSLTSLTLSTPLAATSGGTGASSGTPGDILHFTGATTVGKLADVALGYMLVSGGVSVVPAWSATPKILTSLSVGTLNAVAGATLVVSGGDLAFENDATNNIGQSGARRPAVAFLSTGVAIGASPATVGAVRLPNTIGIQSRNAANGANAALLSLDASDVCTLGDNSFATILKGTSIKWNVAEVALGGGATPTLGTIGGSGPTGAAQTGWLKVTNSAGAVRFAPIFG